MSIILVMPTVGSCISTRTQPSNSGPIAIAKPVGQGQFARNLPQDVKTIQAALNQVTAKGFTGGPLPLLIVDGNKGPKTQAAIIKFQQAQVKSIIADGVIDPGGKTILRLNELVAPISKFDLNAKLAAALPLVKAALAAAIQNVTMVITNSPGTPGTAAVAGDRLDRHFALGTTNESGQSNARVNLFETYSEMAFVVNRPDLFNMIGSIDAFDVDPSNAKIALTNAQGVFEPALIEGEPNPARSIRLGLGFFAPNVSSDFAAYILLHELAHFTGRRDGERIVDNGRGWFDDAFIKPLSTDQRLLNADSYASFAHECRTNSSVKPVFVKTSPGGLGGAR